ncbi:MAG: hypothetical protein IJR85_04685 [Synergistaceae bacterium]|nr:hypothetical protein [Synergistaceae bacterium]
MAEYYRKLTEITEIPAPDDLVQGGYVADIVALASPGDYKRGLVLMSGEDGFIPATSAGIGSADEACILAENISFTEGTCSASAYFGGIINSERVILGYETESDNHSELISAVKPVLRAHKLFLV